MTDTTTEPPALRLDEPDFRSYYSADGLHDDCDHSTDDGPREYDDVSAGWDIGHWTRLNFVRQGDGTFYVSVHADAGPLTHRSCTAEDLRLLAQHLLAVADAS